MTMLILLGFILPIFIIIFTDFYQVGNIKETVDSEFKRAVNDSLVVYVNDKYSTDREAKLTLTDRAAMQAMIKDQMSQNLLNKYNIDIKFKSLDVNISDKIYVKYDGTVNYKPSTAKVAKLDTDFTIKVHGRSKAQRFDIK